jgi:hypothetical protein
MLRWEECEGTDGFITRLEQEMNQIWKIRWKNGGDLDATLTGLR